jgi:NAD(P)-dependent dehydrogenase (short-subunit alcohol dehydrogenase family)
MDTKKGNSAKRLHGKVAVITGSTGGMGEGIARRLAAEGAAVVVSGRRTAQGEHVAQDIRASGGQAVFVRADVAREADCMGLIRGALDQFGRLDILVNNAGITPLTPLDKETVENWDQVFATNVRGAFLCCREVVPAMRRLGGGRIINIGSTVPSRGVADRLAYGCSKGALLTMTKMLARGLLADRILVNWIAVGWVATPVEIELRSRLEGDGLAFLEEKSRQAPLGRLETVEDIAAGVVYLASDEASHVTGCELNISGGLWT